MTYRLTEGDKNVVSNIRQDLKDKVTKFKDEEIAETWRHFSNSEDYLSENRNEKFLEWLEDCCQ